MNDPKVIYARETIQHRLEGLSATISEALNNCSGGVTYVVVLKGGFRFGADLIDVITVDCRRIRLEFMRVEAYAAAGKILNRLRLHTLADAPDAFSGRHVVIIDDIFDTGTTMQSLRRYIGKFNPATIREAVLLWRKHPSTYTVEPPTWHGFTLEHGTWVYGYGMDETHEDKRTLSCIAGKRP